ncbi:MAG: hypothetical protein C5B51_31940 [Terriglobia bacterium]|nr:MAG: hypothetical protein C5B51_31940 [Terriglobia bacterium]
MPRILVADNDVAQLDLRCRMLEAGGYTVLAAFCPSEALRHLARADLILMDLRFPNSEGVDDADVGMALIREIRESGCHLPLIVLSGWPADLEGQPEEQMVSRVMVKPVSFERLLQAVGELVT